MKYDLIKKIVKSARSIFFGLSPLMTKKRFLKYTLQYSKISEAKKNQKLPCESQRFLYLGKLVFGFNMANSDFEHKKIYNHLSPFSTH